MSYVAQARNLYTTGFDMGGLVFEAADISSVTLHVSYATDANYPTVGSLTRSTTLHSLALHS